MSQMITQLTANLWISQSKFFATNSGILLNSDRACLLDPCMLLKEIEAIAGFLEERQANPQAIILTHSHWDHILGTEPFPDAKIIAHASYLNEVSGDNGARILRQISEWEAQVEIERPPGQPFHIPLPDETFVESCSLKIGDTLSLTLAHAPGHAADQLVVYDPQSAMLWASDILSDLEIPFVSHNLAAYEQTLATLSEWEIQVLVPGHGHPTTSPGDIRQRFAEDMAYLAELREAVESAIERGETVEETVVGCANITYRRPDDNRGAHKLNVESVYLELGGQADPTSVGWNRSSSD